MSRLPFRLHRRRPRPSVHVDDATLLRMLKGEQIDDGAAVLDHVAICAACRREMERLDPLSALVAADVSLAAAPPRIPLPQPARRPPSTRRIFALVVPVAAMVTIAVAVVGTRHEAAPPGNQIAQLTAAIRLAAAHHDAATLHRLLSEASTALHQLDAGGIGDDTSLRNDLYALRDAVEQLPQDADTAAVVDGVDSVVAAASAPSPSPGSTPEQAPEESPAADVTPVPTDASSPPPAPNATATPTPDSTTPTDTPTPDTTTPTDTPTPDLASP